MKYVYILESLASEHFYVGITDDLRARLAKHNAGEVTHTAKYRPWQVQDLHRIQRRKAGVCIRTVSEIGIWPRIC